MIGSFVGNADSWRWLRALLKLFNLDSYCLPVLHPTLIVADLAVGLEVLEQGDTLALLLAH